MAEHFEDEKAAWTVTGIVLIVIAVFDSVYFILSHKRRPASNVPAVVDQK